MVVNKLNIHATVCGHDMFTISSTAVLSHAHFANPPAVASCCISYWSTTTKLCHRYFNCHHMIFRDIKAIMVIVCYNSSGSHSLTRKNLCCMCLHACTCHVHACVHTFSSNALCVVTTNSTSVHHYMYMFMHMSIGCHFNSRQHTGKYYMYIYNITMAQIYTHPPRTAVSSDTCTSPYRTIKFCCLNV